MKKVLLLSCLVMLSACVSNSHVTNISVASNKNVNLKSVNLDKATQKSVVSGKDSAFTFLFIPLGFPKMNIALDEALTKADADLLIDGTVYRKSWWFIIGQRTIEVKGTAVKTRGASK